MNRATLRWMAFSGAIVLALGFATPAVRAQNNDDQLRGVARISVMEGDVQVRRGDSGDWVAGVVNAPLMTDDRISTGPNSRAEVEFDSANVLRMGGTSEIRLTTLEANRYQMDLAHGTVSYRVLRPSTVNIEVDTPNVSIKPSKIGIYRIAVTDAGETELTVRAGDVEVFSPRGSQWVNAGQVMTARGNPSDPEFQMVAANPPDDWDRWCESRDRLMLNSTSQQHVPPGVYGTEDMDASGTWVNYPDYGSVWHPAAGPDWAPYGCGRWVWEDWYGWTWIGCEPWGWAPYHYGRWFWGAGYGWLWYPGVIGVRHYWSPALVGFFGFGGGVGIGAGFGFGNIGWVPLAPYEMFHPWWGRGFYGSQAYFNRSMNVGAVNVGSFYRNARVANGARAVSAADFRNGRFNNVMRPTGGQLQSAGLIRGQMPMAPSSASMRFSDRQVSAAPRTNESARFFRQQQPSAVQHFGGTASMSATRGQSMTPATRPSAAGNSVGGWRRFGEPAGSGAGSARVFPSANSGSNFRGNQNPVSENGRTPQASGGNGGNGWQRFGEPGGGNRVPSYSAPSSRSGVQQSAPRYSAPAPGSSPRSYSAPSSSGGGGRPSGGGGGGGHAGGGHGGGGGHR